MNDIWAYAIERARDGEIADRGRGGVRGRVLRVKGGYNPNSSSVGSSIPTFLTIAASTGALAVVLLNALAVVGKLVRRQTEAEPSPRSATAGAGDEGEASAKPSDGEPGDGEPGDGEPGDEDRDQADG